MTAVNFTYSADNSQYVASLGEMVTATANFGQASQTLAGNIAALGVATTKMVGSVAMGKQAFSNAQQMAAAYEQKLSALEARTVVAGKSFDKVGMQIRQMARDLPGGINMAVQQVDALQRMGVTSEKALVPLARTMAKIGAANAELGPQLTQSFAQLQRTFGTLDPTATARFGDSLTRLSSKAGASATGISDFSNAIAPLGQTLGLTQTQVMGFAAGFAKSGQEGYLAANVFNRMLSDMERSAREGTGELQIYADTVGMTSKAFTSLVKSNPAEAVLSVFDAFSKGGADSLRTLERLGMDGPRTLKTITAVAQSGDLRKMVNEAASGFGDGSTQKGAETAFGGLNDEMSKSVETMQQLTEAAGRPLLNVMTELVKQANAVGGAFTNVVNNDWVQRITGVLMAAGGGLTLAKSAGTAILGIGAANSLIGAVPQSGRERMKSGLTWMGANRGKIAMGAGGMALAGSMMDNPQLAMLGGMGLLASNIMPGGAIGKGLNMLRKGALAGSDMFYWQSADWSKLTPMQALSGQTPYDSMGKAWKDASEKSGIRAGKLGRMFGRDEAALVRAMSSAAGGITPDMDDVAQKSFYKSQLRASQLPANAQLRAGWGPGGFFKSLGMGGLATAGSIGAALGPTLPVAAGVAGAVGLGVYGYSQWSNTKKYREMAEDDSLSAARVASEKYGVPLKPLFDFNAQVEQATEAISTWSEAVSISGSRASWLNEQYQSGSGEPKMEIADDASQAEILSMVVARGGAQSPQLMAQLMNDVARQRGSIEANQIGQQVLDARKNLPGALGQAMNQITSDAEGGQPWYKLTGFNAGYGGKDENLEAAGGVADQARAMLEEAYSTGGVGARAKKQTELLDEFDKQMLDDLKNRTFDEESWTKALRGVIGERAAEYASATADSFDKKRPGAGRVAVDREEGDSLSTVRDEIMKESTTPVTNVQLSQAQDLKGLAGQNTAQFLQAAQRMGLTPAQLADIVRNGPKSEYAEKLGVGGGTPSTTDISRALAANGLTTAGAAQGVANQAPQNPILQFQAAQRAVQGSGNAMLERQRIMQNLTSGKPMDQATRESYQAQLQLLDQQLVPMQMQRTMTASQQRQMRGTMARQQYAMAIQNPDDAESQARAGEALAQMQQIEAEETQWLQSRARQTYDFQKSTNRAWEDYYLGVSRAQEDFQISSARAEEDYQIQRKRTLEEYNIGIQRQAEDHNVQMKRMAEDTAKGMVQPFQVLQPQEVWSMGAMSSNIDQQTKFIERQLDTIDKLRKRGLSQQAIDTFDLANPANAQRVSWMENSSKAEIRQANRAARRAGRAGEGVRDEQQSTRRYEEDYEKSLRRSGEDLNRSLRNSEQDFRRSMDRSRQDFNRTMDRQARDMRKNMRRQLQDFRDMDLEFIGDKKKLMHNISKVVEGGSADWESTTGHAMENISSKSADEWLNVRSSSDSAMKWLEKSWKQFALDGSTPTSGPASAFTSAATTGSAQTKDSKTSTPQSAPDLKNPKSNKKDPANQRQSKSLTSAPSGMTVTGAGSDMTDHSGGVGGPVSKAWDGQGNLWGGMSKKWKALFEVIGKYGPLDKIDSFVPGGNNKKTANAAAKWLWQSLLADGYTEEQAAGILGNIDQESGFSPTVDQPDGPGMGIAQWSQGGRWEGLKAWAKKRGMNPMKLETQYGYMRHEMNTGTFTDGRWSDAEFRNTKSVQDAANYFGANYEIFGISGDRNADADAWYNTFGGKVGAGDPTKRSASKNSGLKLWEIGDAIDRKGRAAQRASRQASKSPGGPIDFSGYPQVIGEGDWGPPMHGAFSFSRHGGTQSGDFNAGLGTPIYAIADGVIVDMRTPVLGPEANNNASYSYGNTIVMYTGNWFARYAHLRAGKPYAPGVSKGAEVEAGQLLGWTGTTGHSSGPHLHFELSQNFPRQYNTSGQSPLDTLAKHGVRLAKGGVVTSAQLAMIGEAGDSEAVIPLNKRGVEAIAEALGRYAMSYEARKARAMAHGTATTTTSQATYHSDHSTHFNGPIEVKADDPNQMIDRLRAEQRKRSLYAASQGGTR